jgi:hypothetical protein
MTGHAQQRSDVLYLRLARADVAMFRFLLEAWDNLALFTSLGADPGARETLLLRFAPGLRQQVLGFLDAARTEFPLELLPAAPPAKVPDVVQANPGGTP